MKNLVVIFVALCSLMNFAGCGTPSVPGSPGVPEPIKVLENPTTGERVRYFREISFKEHKDFDEQEAITEWTAKQQKNGFTKDITPEDDRDELADLRRKNLAARQQHQAN
jgi:hypothetical protein